MVRTLEAHQHELLERYDMVLTIDVDEIVRPNPEWGTLGQYLDRFDEEWVNCLGYEILHLKDREGPLRPTGRSSSSADTGSRTPPTTSRRWQRSR